VWRPAETNTSIRPGWFYHPAEDGRVRSVDNLVDLYFTSVGRNSKLLLNIPPTRDGLLHDTDVARIAAFHQRLSATFATNLAGRDPTLARVNTSNPAPVFISVLEPPVTASVLRLEEAIANGQAVARHEVRVFTDGSWVTLTEGTTIGYARLHRFQPTTIERLIVAVNERAGELGPLSARLYA
jgi:alpha-L-fucosidase